MIFRGADTGGFEPDARLTAMWLWTLASASTEISDTDGIEPEDEVADPDEEGKPDSVLLAPGYVLEYDAARKIAQGLGARLEELTSVVAIKGDKARLLPVFERTDYLMGRVDGVPNAKKAAKKRQMALFTTLEEAAEAQGWGGDGSPKTGSTSLDRVHQSMLLFGMGRGEALRRFLVEEGVGKQSQFWTLAQALSALYPRGSDEKRWVDGVLARKKGLGFG